MARSFEPRLGLAADGEGGSKELDPARGARVEAGQFGGSGKPVVDSVGVHAQCTGGAASVEIAVEECCQRRGQLRMAIKRLQKRCQFRGAVPGAGYAVVEQDVLELVYAGPAGECRDKVGAFRCGRYVARGGGGCGADDRG
nr:hypothetical protein [Streptomyces tanashiensis]